MNGVNIKDYVGPETMKRMQKTKWYALARFLDDILYNGRDALRDPKNPHSTCFQTSNEVFVGDAVPAGVVILGHEGSYINTAKGLRELAHECERMALKEVT